VEIHGPVLAVLTVIGGLDTRPRLGGLVQHGDLGVGTIAKIENRGRVLILFHGRKAAKTCVLGILKPVKGLIDYMHCINLNFELPVGKF
jgi:E3 ubiquitin-protein ligase HERC2